MQNYLLRQNQLKKTANVILADLKLTNFLEKFGQTNFVGSYALDLMSYEDIDIVVTCDPKPEYLFRAIEYLFLQPHVYSLPWVQDFRKSIYPDRPQGLYLQVNYLLKPENFWKIDIWFLPKNELKALEDVEKYKNKLTDESRLIILTIKNKMREQLPHGKQVSGVDVYKAVLEKGVKDLESFKQYLISQGREV